MPVWYLFIWMFSTTTTPGNVPTPYTSKDSCEVAAQVARDDIKHRMNPEYTIAVTLCVPGEK